MTKYRMRTLGDLPEVWSREVDTPEESPPLRGRSSALLAACSSFRAFESDGTEPEPSDEEARRL